MATAVGANAQVAAGDAAGTASQQLQEVTITGSRVIANGNDSPTPVTVVTVEDIQATRPTTIFEGLLDMPEFAGSRGATSNPGGAGPTNGSGSTLSLRGLGGQRTLILYDGHRVPPTQSDGLVNANLIPQMLLQRVDIVSGGVSAVYGSDGIGGAVNFITDRKYNGIKANVQFGISDQHDDRSHELGIAGGMDLFGGRGHLEGSYQTHFDAGILQRTDRAFGVQRWTLQGNGTTLPYFLVPNATLGNTSFGGKITGPANNPLVNQQFVGLGVLGPFNNGSTAGVQGNIQIGGDGGYNTSPSLKAKQDFHQFYGRFDFDVTDNVHYYLTGASAIEHAFNYSNDNSLNAQNTSLSSTNAFLAPAYQTAMTSRGITSFNFGKIWRLGSVGPSTADNYTRQLFVNTGFDGKIGNYRWDASYTRGVAKIDSRQLNAIDNGHLYAALDAVTDSSGKTVCRVTVTNPGLYPGCVPINVFGQGSESPDAISYITRRVQYQPKITMDDVSGSLAGAQFDDWAGPINLALSGEWRKVGYVLFSDSLPAIYDPLDCTGLRFNCTTFNAATGNGSPKASSSSVPRPPVSQTVSEAALEGDIPVLKGLPLAQAVNVNAAYRYAHYSVSGTSIITQPNTTRTFSANTWKVGLDWHFNDAVTLRATRSRDFRAPNLVDLYAPGNITTGSNNPDFLTRTTPTTQVQSGGNANLLPEIGYTTTVGLVLRPTEKFSLAVDGFDITIHNAITGASGPSDIAQNACYASGGTSFYCTLQERPVPIAVAIANPIAAYAITKFYNIPLNIAAQKTWGVDVEGNYKTQVYGHALSLRGLVTYQPHDLQELPGATTQEFAGVDFSGNNQGGAVWRTSVFAHYGLTDKLAVDWFTRWRSRLHHNADPNVIIGRGDNNINPSVAYSNLNLSYNVGQKSWGQANVYLNIQNVFNELGFPTANSGPSSNPGTAGGPAPGDDPVGRYYSVGVRYKM